MAVTAKVNLDVNALKLKCAKQIAKAQLVLDKAVVKDMGEYTPRKSGELQNSSNNNLGQGIVKNVTPYARRQYYGVDFKFSKLQNPKATHHWFEKAKSEKVKQWQDLVNKELNEG